MTDLPPRLSPRDSGDAWVEGPDGRRYWGRYGAAGLLVHDPAAGILLQHRAEWSHFGGTWGLPGGARHEGESAVAGAIREAGEEAGVPADALAVAFTSVFDLGFWSYETVVARAVRSFEPRIGDAESLELRWVPIDDVVGLPLHPGFGASWPQLRSRLHDRVRVVVDAANVVGSRPDGWWKDRAGAAARLLARLEVLNASGIDAAEFGSVAGRVWPSFSVVLEGRARAGATATSAPEPRREAPASDAPVHDVEVVLAEASGDDAIVAQVERLGAGATVVVTADRELAARATAQGAEVRGPRWLLDLLDAAPAPRP